MMKFLTIWFIALFLSTLVQAQQKITYTAVRQPVSRVLDDISGQFGIKFAYDTKALEQITTSLSVTDLPITKFLNLLEKQNGLKSRLVEGTWIVTAGKAVIVPVQDVVQETVRQPAREVKGFVSDIVTGEPLAYCNIALTGNRGTITNELGFFSLPAITDSVRFHISHLGYHRLDTIVSSASAKDLRIRLKPFSVLMKEVNVVMKEKNILEISEASGRIGFNPAQSANVPRLAADDLANMLTLIPGISFLGGATGGISIRGGDPSENLVLLDGIPLLETGHLFGNISMLNAGFIRHSFVSRGGFDAGFGDRVSGLIELSGRTGSLSGPTVETTASLLNGDLLATIPVSKFLSISGAWRKSYVEHWPNYLFQKLLEDSRISTFEGEEASVVPTVRFQDINLKASIHPSSRQEITLNFIQGDDQQMLDYQVGEDQKLYRNEWARENNLGWSANWNYQSGKWLHQLSAGYNDLRYAGELESGSQETVTVPGNQGKGNTKKPKKIKPVNVNRQKYELDSDSNRVLEFRSNWKSEWKTGKFTHQLGGGLVNNYFNYSFTTLSSENDIPVDSLHRASDQYIGHLFFQEAIEPFKMLKIRMGIRTNYNRFTQRTYWQPRGGIEFIPSSQFKAYFNAGIYHQFLTRVPRIDINNNVDLIWFLPDDTGNGLLESRHQVAGVQFSSGGLLIHAELYDKQTSGKQWLYAELYKKGNVSRIHYVPRDGKERNSGIDLFTQFRHHVFNHQLSWSLAKSEEQIAGINNATWFPSLNDHRHTLQWVEMASIRGWAASVSWTYRTGQPRILPGNTPGALSFERLDYFSQLDASVSRSIRTNHFGIHGGVSFLNILNRKNVVQVDYLNISTNTGSFSGQANVSTLSFSPVFFLRMQIF